MGYYNFRDRDDDIPQIVEDAVASKPWFAEDDYLYVHHSEDFDSAWNTVRWSSETFIAGGQLSLAFHDTDVMVGDVEAGEIDYHECTPNIMLTIRDDAGGQSWPTQTNAELVSLATERFRQNKDNPGWDTESVDRMLRTAGMNADNARVEYQRGNDLRAQEELADALNYFLFAMDLMENK